VESNIIHHLLIIEFVILIFNNNNYLSDIQTNGQKDTISVANRFATVPTFPIHNQTGVLGKPNCRQTRNCNSQPLVPNGQTNQTKVQSRKLLTSDELRSTIKFELRSTELHQWVETGLLLPWVDRPRIGGSHHHRK
jgi:hypothetical protein